MNSRREHESQWTYEERKRQHKAIGVAVVYMLAFFGVVSLVYASVYLMGGFNV